MQLTHTPAQFHVYAACGFLVSFTWCVLARSIFDFGDAAIQLMFLLKMRAQKPQKRTTQKHEMQIESST
jgi:hypothetical protein